MPRSKNLSGNLGSVIQEMRERRQQYLNQVAEIDKIFASYGIQLESPSAQATAKGPGRPPKAAAEAAPAPAKAAAAPKKGKRGRRTRGSFAISGEQSILDFVRSRGTPTTKEINEHWINEGRGGKADNALTKMVSSGQLKRLKDPNVRGSRYQVA